MFTFWCAIDNCGQVGGPLLHANAAGCPFARRSLHRARRHLDKLLIRSAQVLPEAIPLLAKLLAGFVPIVQAKHAAAIIHACSYVGAESLLAAFCQHLELSEMPRDAVLACAFMIALHPFQATEAACARIVEELSTCSELSSLLGEHHWKDVADFGGRMAAAIAPATLQAWMKPLARKDPRAAALALLLTYGAAAAEVQQQAHPPASHPPAATQKSPRAAAGPAPDAAAAKPAARRLSRRAKNAQSKQNAPTEDSSTMEASTSGRAAKRSRPGEPPDLDASRQHQPPAKRPRQRSAGGRNGRASRSPSPPADWMSLYQECCTASAVSVLPAGTLRALLDDVEGGAPYAIRAPLLDVLCSRSSSPAGPWLAVEVPNAVQGLTSQPRYGIAEQSHGKTFLVALPSDGGDNLCRIVWVCPCTARMPLYRLSSDKLNVHLPTGKAKMSCAVLHICQSSPVALWLDVEMNASKERARPLNSTTLLTATAGFRLQRNDADFLRDFFKTQNLRSLRPVEWEGAALQTISSSDSVMLGTMCKSSEWGTSDLAICVTLRFHNAELQPAEH